MGLGELRAWLSGKPELVPTIFCLLGEGEWGDRSLCICAAAAVDFGFVTL